MHLRDGSAQTIVSKLPDYHLLSAPLLCLRVNGGSPGVQGCQKDCLMVTVLCSGRRVALCGGSRVGQKDVDCVALAFKNIRFCNLVVAEFDVLSALTLDSQSA